MSPDNVQRKLTAILSADVVGYSGLTAEAVVTQRVIQARNVDLQPDRRMRFRNGVHSGDIMVERDRIYGDGVNIAARLEGLAEPGGICLSRTVDEQVEKKLSVELEDLGEQVLKNIPKPARVCRVRLGAAAREHQVADEPHKEAARDRV